MGSRAEGASRGAPCPGQASLNGGSASLVEADVLKVLVEVMARRHVPALHLLPVDDDTVPPDDGNAVCLAQGVLLEFAQQRIALVLVELALLPVVEVIQLGILVASIIDRGSAGRYVLGE